MRPISFRRNPEAIDAELRAARDAGQPGCARERYAAANRARAASRV